MSLLSGINLNLLLVLDMLLKEQNVSKAAEKLNLTQPTISNSLKQLRVIFNDELLFRGPGNRMLLTGKAKALRRKVAETVSKLENIFYSEEKFNPDKESYHFKLGMSDYAAIIYLPKIMKNIERYTDNISIEVVHLNNIWNYEDYKNSNVDLAIGNYTIDNDIVNKQNLFTSKIVCAASKKHPAFQKESLTVDDFFKYKHLTVFYKKEYWVEVDRIILEKTGKKRKVVVKVPHMLVGLKLLSESDFICMLSNQIAEKYSELYNLNVKEPPIEFPISAYNMYWSKADNSSSVNQWLRHIIEKIQI